MKSLWASPTVRLRVVLIVVALIVVAVAVERMWHNYEKRAFERAVGKVEEVIDAKDRSAAGHVDKAEKAVAEASPALERIKERSKRHETLRKQENDLAAQDSAISDDLGVVFSADGAVAGPVPSTDDLESKLDDIIERGADRPR